MTQCKQWNKFQAPHKYGKPPSQYLFKNGEPSVNLEIFPLPLYSHAYVSTVQQPHLLHGSVTNFALAVCCCYECK